MKLKIAQITPFYYPSIGGVQGVVKYLAEELVNLGHQVDVITANREHSNRPKLIAKKFEVINGVNVFRYNSIINAGHISFMPGLISHFLKYKYDVLHYHNYRHPHCELASFFGNLNKSVNILHGHGPFFENGEISKTKQKFYNVYDAIAKKTVLKFSNKIFALNQYEKNRYISLGINENKIEIIPNAAEDICFKKVDSKPFIDKYKLHNKKIILFVGILNGAKRPDLLIRSLPLILNKIPDAHLFLVGPDGGYLETVKRLVTELNLENNFTYGGPLFGIEKQQVFRASDLFALPSDLDAYPLVLLEALAHGLPLVSTDARGPASIIEENRTGYIIPKGDVNALADSIIKILTDENLKNVLSKNAKETAIEKYSSKSITKKIQDIYFELLKQVK